MSGLVLLGIESYPQFAVGGTSSTFTTSDAFAGTATSLGANWTSNQSGFQLLTGEAVTLVAGTDASAHYNATTWAANQFSEVVLGAAVSADGVGVGYGPGVRWSTSGAATGYRCVANGSGWEMFEFVGGSGTPMTSATTPTFAAGDTVYFEFVGTNFIAKKNTTTFASGSNATISSGAPAIVYSSTASDLSNGIASWLGGTL